MVLNNEAILHICETCGKEELLSSEEAFQKGWDYPPRMGLLGVISPRTCGNCAINTTLWWEVVCEKKSVDQLDEKHLKTLKRILTEL